MADEVVFDLLQGGGCGGIGAVGRLPQPARGERSCSLDPLVDENAQDVVERLSWNGVLLRDRCPPSTDLCSRLMDDPLHLGIGLCRHSLDGVRLMLENVEPPLDLWTEDFCETSPSFAQSMQRDGRARRPHEARENTQENAHPQAVHRPPRRRPRNRGHPLGDPPTEET